MAPLEYLAGILDVSGSLTITRRKNRVGPRVMLQIQSLNRELPEMFAQRFGGAVYWQEVSSGKRWAWAKQGTAAQKVLRALRPHIRVRALDFDRILFMRLRNRGGSQSRNRHAIGAELRRIAARKVADQFAGAGKGIGAERLG